MKLTQAEAAPANPDWEPDTPPVSSPPQELVPSLQPAQAGQPGQPVLTTGPGRAETPQQLRDRIREEVRQSTQQGRDPVFNLPNSFDATNAVPRGAVQITVALSVCLAFVIVFRPLAGALARRSDAQNEALRSGGPTIGAKLEQLQESVDAMSVEIERITESQRFQAKLLAERVKETENAAH